MLSFLHKYEKTYTYCQQGEEGILEEIIRRIPSTPKICCEIGGNDGVWLSNTALLIKNGWSGKFVEADFNLWQKCCTNWKGYPVKSQCSMVDETNINAFVQKDCSVLSIDTDGVDYRIFKALDAKPAIVIVEIDSSIPPTSDEFNNEGGAGYFPMVKLGIEKGYFLLCHTGNLIFVDNKYRKLFKEIIGDGIENYAEYFKTDWLKKVA